MSILIRFYLRRGNKVMRKLLKRFLDWLSEKRFDGGTPSPKEKKRALRELKKFEKFVKNNKVNR